MKKRTIIFLTITTLICVIFGILIIVHNTHTDKRYQIENISNEYFQSDDTVVATVNDNNITNREVSLAKYSYHTKNALDKAIEQKAIVQLANTDGYKLSKTDLEKERDYINNTYEKLNLPDNEKNQMFKEDLIKNHLEMVTSIKYQNQIKMLILHQEFCCDDELINKEYEEYKTLYNEWEAGGKESSKLYKQIWNLREKIAQEYIQKRIEQLQIKKY